MSLIIPKTQVNHKLDPANIRQDENGVLWNGKITILQQAVYEKGIPSHPKRFEALVITAARAVDSPKSSPRSLFSRNVIEIHLVNAHPDMWRSNTPITIRRGENNVIYLVNLENHTKYSLAGQGKDFTLFI